MHSLSILCENIKAAAELLDVIFAAAIPGVDILIGKAAPPVVHGRCRFCEEGETVQGRCQSCGTAVRCSVCRKIRDAAGDWITDPNPQGPTSDTYCHECAQILYPKYYARILEKRKAAMHV